MKHNTLPSFIPLAGTTLIAGIPAAHAIPTLPHPVVFTQSDGRQFTIRIIDDEQGQQIRSTESDNMDFGIGTPDDIRMLYTDGQKLQLWGDKAHMGSIFPKIRF